MIQLATIGYEGANIDDFIATLQASGISLLVDVRELPISRRKGFAKTALSSALKEAGIRYVHLKGLGDPKSGREAARSGDFKKFLKIYSKHMTSEVAQADLELAMTYAAQETACLMCFERDHTTCHRTIVAAAISGSIDATITHLGVREGAGKNSSRTRSRKGFGPGQGVAACGR